MEPRVNRRKFMTGEVIGDKMMKTRIVRIASTTKHAKYGKTLQCAAKFKAHDEKNATKMGDVVRIMETRRLSKDKRWIIMEIVKQASAESV